MAKFLISFLILVTANITKAEPSIEVQESIKAMEAYQKECEKHASRPIREKKIEELSREDYFKLKDICASYDMKSTLRAVNNISKLEKENLAKLANMPEVERNKNIESRVQFFTDAMLNTPLSWAENMISLVELFEYTRLANNSKNEELKNAVAANIKKIKDNKEKIYETTMKHDLSLVLAEYRYTKDGDPKEQEAFKSFISKFTPYTNEIKKNLSCLAQEKCKICGDKFLKKCETKKATSKAVEGDFEMFREKYEEATFNFFKRVNRF